MVELDIGRSNRAETPEMAQTGLNMSRRIRRTPYTDRAEMHGVRGYSVVNHTLLPKAYAKSVEEDYWHLREHVQIWDVGCQRQGQGTGPDAATLVQLMTPRDLRGIRVGQGLYIPLIDEHAGMLNDPVLLKLSDQRFWLSIADSDVLLFAKGIAFGRGLDVVVEEPDVSPLAIQGPKAEALMKRLFGQAIGDLPYFGFATFDVLGTRQVIARSGYSKQGGFEIYLEGGHLGGDLWDLVWQAGQDLDIRPGCPNLIERIEGGLLSYGNEFTRANNPLECGFERFCHLGEDIEYIGREALLKIAKDGPERHIMGVTFGGKPVAGVAIPLAVIAEDGTPIGEITSGLWSPRLGCNIGVGMIARSHWNAGTRVIVRVAQGNQREGRVSSLPF